jgi:hypothetical protein
MAMTNSGIYSSPTGSLGAPGLMKKSFLFHHPVAHRHFGRGGEICCHFDDTFLAGKTEGRAYSERVKYIFKYTL